MASGWRQELREKTGRNSTIAERREAKNAYVSEDEVDARMGKGTYDALREQEEQKQFGTNGYYSGSRREKRRFDRRFNRRLRNDRLALSPKPSVIESVAPAAPPAQDKNYIYPLNFSTYQIRPIGGSFLQFPIRTSQFSRIGTGVGNNPKSTTDWNTDGKQTQTAYDVQQRIQNEHLTESSPEFVSSETYFNVNDPSPSIKHSAYDNLGYTFTTPTTLQPTDNAPVSSTNKKYNINSSEYFRAPYAFANKDGGSQMITVNGRQYPIAVTKNIYGKADGFENDQTYAYDETTGKFIKVKENIFGSVKGGFDGAQFEGDWFDPNSYYQNKQAWIKANPEPSRRGSLGGIITPEWTEWNNRYIKASQTGFKKQGGKMNKIKYFQQGGTMNQQQDIQQQIMKLVQAAIQGNQEAIDKINQIEQAAQQGDPQAAQLNQMIQQVVEQMKGQATSAKWGSKLQYIKSLKYAKGGKTCPSCQNGGDPLQTPVVKKSTKKVEEKACGGKAKKRYFGGYI